MKLTVLGNNGPFPGRGGACSGYLLETDNTKILIDCGSGVLANMQKYCRIEELNAIILSHLHNDHISDMSVLKYAVSVSRIRTGEQALKNIEVYCPGSPQRELELIDKNAFNMNIVGDGLGIIIKDLEVSFAKMNHPYESYAMKFRHNNKTLVYSGDTSHTEKLIKFSKSANLLIGDSAFLERHRTDNLVHMTAKENAIVASRAYVDKLLLTHFWPYDNVSEYIAEAKKEFENVEAAEIGKQHVV